MKSKSGVSVAMILAAAVGWGFIGLFTRPLGAARLNVLQITFIRSVLTAILMGVFLLIRDRSLFRIRIKDVWMFIGNGLISILFFNACYFLTIESAALSTAAILLYTAPFFVIIFSALFFKEKITPRKIAALVLGFIGCALASGFSGGKVSVTVLLTGIGSGVGYAMYSIFSKAALKRYNMLTLVFYTFTVAAIAILPVARLNNIAEALAADGKNLLLGLGLGILSTFVPYLLYTGGLKTVEAGKASVLAFAEPMVASVLGVVVFGEPLGIRTILGAALILAAIILLNIPPKLLFIIKTERK